MNIKCVPRILLAVLLSGSCMWSALAQEADTSMTLASLGSSSETPHNSPAEAVAESAPAAEPANNLFEILRISGQVRHRSEVDRRSAAEPPGLHLLRTRLNLALTPVDDVTALIQVQDSRLFGSGDPGAGRGTLDGQAQALDLHQAYFAVANIFDSSFRLKVGRQELAYGNQRLIGSVGWSNVGRTFDAGVLGYDGAFGKVDLLAARLVDNRASSQNLLGVVAAFNAGSNKLELYGLHDNNTAEIEVGPDAGSKALARTTVGTTFRGSQQALDYELEGFYQAGKVARGELDRATISAYLFSAGAGINVGKGRIGGLYTMLSGDGDAEDEKQETFNTLFATNHKFYGALDFFPFNAALRPGGLQDIALQTSYNFSSSLSAKLDIHHFMLAKDLGSGDKLGQEVDLTLRYKYNQAFGIMAGASVFFASDQAESALGKDTATWFFLSTVVDF